MRIAELPDRLTDIFGDGWRDVHDFPPNELTVTRGRAPNQRQLRELEDTFASFSWQEFLRTIRELDGMLLEIKREAKPENFSYKHLLEEKLLEEEIAKFVGPRRIDEPWTWRLWDIWWWPQPLVHRADLIDSFLGSYSPPDVLDDPGQWWWKASERIVEVKSRVGEAARSSEGSVSLETPDRRIPQSVKDEVWRRAQGQCAQCGSRVRLEFDHMVPVSKGGSNTARNVELLCERCNRRKGARIG